MNRLRSARREAGLTQSELAARAGVSRQLVTAAEAGRHLPRVDAALALAAALGVDVGSLFAPSSAPRDALTGETPAPGTLVRSGMVGGLVVTAPQRPTAGGWDVADAAVGDDQLELLTELRPGIVVAGCEPGLEGLERHLREAGIGAVAVPASSRAARNALLHGRLHGAVVHGPGDPADRYDAAGVVRYSIASWQVGLAAPADAPAGWWDHALAGTTPVVQREAGAGVQRAFEAAVSAAAIPVAGPVVNSHLEAARRSVVTGLPAVTIEPAALAVGAAFHPLEVHTAELWVADEWAGSGVVTDALTALTGVRFRRLLAGVGGYDLAGSGSRVA